MNHGTALFAAIMSQPGEDDPRLVYADWLEERSRDNPTKPCPACGGRGHIRSEDWFAGDETSLICRTCHGAGTVPDTLAADRAEFIRVQVELARWDRDGVGGVLYPEHIETLRRRERELLAGKQVCDWFAVPGLAVSWTKSEGLCGWYTGNSTIRTTLRRGFVGEVTCAAAAWLAHAAAVFAAQPVERVTIPDGLIQLESGDWYLDNELSLVLSQPHVQGGYATRGDAEAVLSRVAVRFGRLASGRWVEQQCPFCTGYGTTLGCAGDRSNPTCGHCHGSGRRQIPKIA